MLLWLALRVTERGGVGRRAGALPRSLYPLVLGLGGWILGVLVVLMIAPTVPVDRELLAVLSIGTRSAWGYWAWVRRALAAVGAPKWRVGRCWGGARSSFTPAEAIASAPPCTLHWTGQPGRTAPFAHVAPG